jgi:hypothetical protein
MDETHTGQDGLRASRQVVRRSAQALADAIDRALWSFQNMPEAGALRRSLVGCKAELDRALESSGYALEVRDGFATRVRKRRPLSLAAAVASAAARVASACGCPYGGYAPHAPHMGTLVRAASSRIPGMCACVRCRADRRSWAGIACGTRIASTKRVVEGSYYKVTPEAKSGKTGLIPQQLRILGRMLKNNGDGKVYVVSVDGDYAQVAGWPGDAIVGTLRVKVSDLVA